MKLIFITCVVFISCACDFAGTASQDSREAKRITYSYDCLDSAVGGSEANKAISKTTKLIRNLAVGEGEITDTIQNQWGNAFHKDAVETKAFVLLNDAAIQSQLQTVLNDLLAAREEPSKIRYSIYLLKDSAINAFTFGGHIYLTKAMYNKCKNNTDLLYSIIGHEIGHSERGHIKKTIQEMMIAENIFGEQNGASAFQILKLTTGAFNQRNELEADYYGIDLAYNLDKEVCATVKFWKEMSQQENQYNRFEDFFRTHPFSSLRAQCLQKHLQVNFNKSCELR